MIVVDASVAAKWLFVEPYSAPALALVAASARTRQPMVAPALLTFEVTNIIRQRMRRDGLSLDAAQERLRALYGFPVVISSPATLAAEALALADAYGLPAAYDAHYMALARSLGCDLWTDDQRLLRTLAGRLPFVRWIGDYVEEESAP